jgi:Bacterial PH domain
MTKTFRPDFRPPDALPLAELLADDDAGDDAGDDAAPLPWDGPDVTHHVIELDDLSSIPAQVDKYLKADERSVIAVRQHPAVLIVPGLAFAGGLVLAAGLSVAARGFMLHAVWIAWLATSAWAVYRWLEWRAGWFVITGQRLLTVQGLIRRRVDQLPFDKLRDLSMSQSIPGRIAGYGTFHCTSIATGHALETIDMVPDPDGLYRRVMELTLPAKGVRGPRK